MDFWLSRLKLASYRNFSSLKLDFSEGLIAIWGANGTGKTNLLEAISLLAPGRGLRRARYEDMCQLGQNTFAIAARLHSVSEGVLEVGTGLAAGELRRKFRLNQSPATAEDLSHYCHIIWLVPAMDRLFIGPAADRRRFLDSMVLAIDPRHGKRLNDYEKTLRSRNKLLEENCRDSFFLDAVEEQLAGLATAIAAMRCQFIDLLTQILNQHVPPSCFPRIQLALLGTLEQDFMRKVPALEIEEQFRRRLFESRKLDAAAKRTLEGAHRTDLQVFNTSKKMPASLCSTGEQKALLITLLLGHMRLKLEVSKEGPLVLLDEVTAHLDQERRKALFDLLRVLKVQTFMTGTDKELFRELAGEAQFLEIEALTKAE